MRRFLILALDGQTPEHFLLLCRYSTALADYYKRTTIHEISGDRFLCNTASTWSTFLTGKSWKEHGITGFASAARAGEPLVTSEDQLGPTTILSGISPKEVALIAVPLLDARSNRIWLGDGFVPCQQLISPAAIKLQFPNFRTPRSNFAGLHPELSWNDAVKTDIERIAASCTLAEFDLKLIMTRLGSFDVGGHQLFDDLYDWRVDSRVKAFSSLGRALDILFQILTRRNITPVIVSNFSFQRCHKVVNINHLLAAGGYCKFSRHSFSQRSLVLQELANNGRQWQIEPKNTRAYSLTHGTIHINSRDRFTYGTLNQQEATSLKTELLQYLPLACRYRYGMEMFIESSNTTLLPDLVFDIPGADYTFNRDMEQYDVPAGVHSSKGFLAIEDGGTGKTLDAPACSSLVNAFIRR